MAKDDDMGERLAHPKDIVTTVEIIADAKSQVSTINGNLGNTLANIAAEKNIDLPVVKFVAKLQAMEEFKRKRFLTAIDHYIRSMVSQGKWPSEHFGDLFGDQRSEADRQATAISKQKKADAKAFDAPPVEEQTEAQKALAKGIKKLEPKAKPAKAAAKEKPAAETKAKGKPGRKPKLETASEFRRDALSDEEAGEPVGRLPSGGDDNLPAMAGDDRGDDDTVLPLGASADNVESFEDRRKRLRAERETKLRMN
jgi:hypothetical protein